MNELFPLAFANGELRLLTAILLGAGFGFALERAGFGNARKLAAQFYFYDMAVFKVMFTAILVAMVGLFSLAHLGFVSLDMLWINPTYVPSQAIGGLILGAGFVMSGYCPGTSVVSSASGRLDGLVALAGVFIGTAIFAVGLDVIPGFEALYKAGSGEVILLPDLVGVSPSTFIMVLIVLALGGFMLAEKVEARMADTRTRLEDIPTASVSPRTKFAVAGGLAAVTALSMGIPTPGILAPQVALAEVAPTELAESIVRREPGVMIFDLREVGAEDRIPGSIPAADPEAALPLLQTAGPGTRVVIYDSTGKVDSVPEGWPAGPRYLVLDGGFAGWEHDVLTPADPTDASLAAREAAARQNQLSAYFTGAAAAPPSAGLMPLPMIVPNSGAANKKKAGGC